MSGGNPRPDLIEKKSTLLAQALERSPQWRELSANHLEGRTAAFFCYGDQGADEMDETGRPRLLKHGQWFDPGDEPFDDERLAYQGLVWQCRYSRIEVPDPLWRHADMGVGRPYADDQAEDMAGAPEALAAFDRWTDDFVTHVSAKGRVPCTTEAERGAKSTTQ